MKAIPPLRRVLGNAGLLLSGRSVNAVLGLAYMAVTARALGPATLGVLILIHAFAQFVGDVMKFQSWQTLLHFGTRPLAENRIQDFQRVLRFSIFLDLASTVVGLLVGIVGSLVFADKLGWGGSHRTAAALYMLTILVMVSATPMGLMRMLDRFEILARQTALVGLFRLVACGAAFLMHASLEGFLAAWAAGQTGGFIYLAVVGVRELNRRGLLVGFSWRGGLTDGMPKAWKFAWNTNLSAGLDVAMTHATTLLVGGIMGPAPAAFWRIGRQVADAIAKPARLLAAALYPELARLRATGSEAAAWKLARHTGLTAGSVVALLLCVSIFAGGWLLRLIIGSDMPSAAATMNWQVGATVIGAFALPLEPMLITQGRAGAVVRVQLVVSAIYLAALPAILHGFGLTGAGAALVAAEAGLAAGWMLAIFRKRRRAAPVPAPTGDDE